jgi:hypothetical protein
MPPERRPVKPYIRQLPLALCPSNQFKIGDWVKVTHPVAPGQRGVFRYDAVVTKVPSLMSDWMIEVRPFGRQWPLYDVPRWTCVGWS